MDFWSHAYSRSSSSVWDNIPHYDTGAIFSHTHIQRTCTAEVWKVSLSLCLLFPVSPKCHSAKMSVYPKIMKRSITAFNKDINMEEEEGAVCWGCPWTHFYFIISLTLESIFGRDIMVIIGVNMNPNESMCLFVFMLWLFISIWFSTEDVKHLTFQLVILHLNFILSLFTFIKR